MNTICDIYLDAFKRNEESGLHKDMHLTILEKRCFLYNTWLSQSTSCCSLRLRSFPVARKLAPSIDPVVLKAQHDPHLPCFQIMHKPLKKMEYS